MPQSYDCRQVQTVTSTVSQAALDTAVAAAVDVLTADSTVVPTSIKVKYSGNYTAGSFTYATQITYTKTKSL
jgi:hypothetical protein